MKTEVIGYFQEVFAYWGKLIFQWQIEWMTAPGNQGEILDWNVKYPNTADINTVDLKELSCVGLYWEILIKNMYSEFLFFFSDFQNQLSSVYKCSSMEPIAHLKLFSSFGVLNINLWKAQCAVPELISALSSQWQIMTSVTPVQLFFSSADKLSWICWDISEQISGTWTRMNRNTLLFVSWNCSGS